MSVRTGLDRMIDGAFQHWRGRRIGVLCNQASIASNWQHVLEALGPPHRSGLLSIEAVFGPEHGLWGHTQDNMIEWEGLPDPRTGLVIHSLYGKHRQPTPGMLSGIDLFVVDIPDVGARYYTFVWSMALCMESCERAGIPVIVLDRPNPIGGDSVQGTVLDSAFNSFVGLFPLPTRHGMTVGEIATYLRQTVFPRIDLEVVKMDGWNRKMDWGQTGLPWAIPSPNMPTVDTAFVYPGMCLLEATTVSEGRGTTRPFEIFGAPGVDGWKLAESLNSLGLEGVHFRPIQFEPTFNKHSKTLCEGCFIHVTDRSAFDSVLAAIAILQEFVRRFPDAWAWKPPPYEYEFEKWPIDILAGNDWLRKSIEELEPLSRIDERMRAERGRFAPARESALLYA